MANSKKIKKVENGEKINPKLLRTLIAVLFLVTQILPYPNLSYAADATYTTDPTATPTSTVPYDSSTTTDTSTNQTSTSLTDPTTDFLSAKTTLSTSQVIEVRPGESIQAAIDQAQPGDTIRIYGQEGFEYQERPALKESITLEGINNPVMNIGDTIDQLQMKTGVTIRGLTIRRDAGSSYVQMVYFADAVRNALIENSVIEGWVTLSSENILRNNVIRSPQDGALWINGGNNQILKNLVIVLDARQHSSAAGDVTVIYVGGANNLIDGNTEVGFGTRPATGYKTTIYCRGIQLGNEASGTRIVNNIFYRNGDYAIAPNYNVVPEVSYNILDKGGLGGGLGTGNLFDVDPQFVDAANGDFHLKSTSPAIDSGDPNSPLDPDGTRRDIGAFYFEHRPEYIHVDSDTPLVIGQRINITSSGREFFVLIYDSSEGLDRLRFLREVTITLDSGGKYTFVDAYTTLSGRQIVSVGFDADHSNITVIIDPRTGEELRLDGAVTSVTYEGSLATYTVVSQKGDTSKVTVNLETLKIVPAVILDALLKFYGPKLLPSTASLSWQVIQDASGNVIRWEITVRLNNSTTRGVVQNQFLILTRVAGQFRITRTQDRDYTNRIITQASFSYDRNGNLTSITRTDGAGRRLSTIYRYPTYYLIVTRTGKRKIIRDLSIPYDALIKSD